MAPSPEPAFPLEANVRESRQQAPIRALDPIVVDTNRRYFSDHRWDGRWRDSSPWCCSAPVYMDCGTGILSGMLCRRQLGAAAPPRDCACSRTRGGSATASSTRIARSAGGTYRSIPTPSVDVSATTDGLGRVVLSLSATEKTWLSITSNGKKVFSGILEPRQSKTLSGSEDATLKVGNAGGSRCCGTASPSGRSARAAGAHDSIHSGKLPDPLARRAL